MRLHARLLTGGLAVLTLSVAILAVRAADPVAGVLKLAGMVEKGDKGVEAEAKKVAEEGLEATMAVLKRRDKGGLGIGSDPKAYPANEDGIEAKLMSLAKRELKPAELKKQGPDLEKAAYIMAGLSYVSELHVPKKKVGDKDPKEWMKTNDEMKQGATDLAAALKKGDPALIKKVASKLNASCNNCHGVFRD